MTGFKNQHYVQKAYLEGFSAKHLPDKWQNTKAIWVLRKDTGRIRLQSIKKTAVRKYYYSFLDKKGAMNPLIEKWFNPVEKEFPKLRQHIRDHISEINLTGEASNLDRRYRPLLAEYIYIHMIRVPKLLDQIKKKSITFHRRLDEEKVLPYEENATQLTALRVLIRVGQSPEMNIVNDLIQRSLNIEFFPRTKVALATSDSPVILYDETRSPGLAYQTTHVIFPLDSSIILWLVESGDQIRMVKHRQIEKSAEFNHLIGLMADNEVYCNNPDTLQEIGKRIGIDTTVDTRT